MDRGTWGFVLILLVQLIYWFGLTGTPRAIVGIVVGSLFGAVAGGFWLGLAGMLWNWFTGTSSWAPWMHHAKLAYVSEFAPYGAWVGGGLGVIAGLVLAGKSLTENTSNPPCAYERPDGMRWLVHALWKVTIHPAHVVFNGIESASAPIEKTQLAHYWVGLVLSLPAVQYAMSVVHRHL